MYSELVVTDCPACFSSLIFHGGGFTLDISHELLRDSKVHGSSRDMFRVPAKCQPTISVLHLERALDCASSAARRAEDTPDSPSLRGGKAGCASVSGTPSGTVMMSYYNLMVWYS